MSFTQENLYLNAIEDAGGGGGGSTNEGLRGHPMKSDLVSNQFVWFTRSAPGWLTPPMSVE